MIEWLELCGVTLKNPVMTASGTFGSGAEYSEFTDLNRLGAVVTKGVANVPWPGNPTPRVAEVYGGMLNAVGLQNPGIDLFCERDIPFLKKYDTKIIVNVCGHSTEEYVEVVKRLAEEPVDMLEINISCPNVKEGGIFSVIFCGLLSGIFVLGRDFFLRLYTTDPNVLTFAVQRLLIVTTLELLTSTYEISGGAMRGFGHSLTRL